MWDLYVLFDAAAMGACYQALVRDSACARHMTSAMECYLDSSTGETMNNIYHDLSRFKMIQIKEENIQGVSTFVSLM